MRALLAVPLLIVAASTVWADPLLYVTDCSETTCGHLSVLDTATGWRVTSVSITGPPDESFPTRGVAVNPAGTRAYVSSSYGNGLAVVDTTTNQQVALVPTLGDGGFEGVTVSADGTRVWVTDEYGGLAVVDATNNTLLAVQILDNVLPRDVLAHPDGQRLYVTTENAGVLVVDAATLEIGTTIPASDPWSLAVDPSGTRVYVADAGVDGVLVIDAMTDTLLTTVPIAGTFPSPRAVAVRPDGTRVYASNLHANTVSVIDTATNTEIATIPTFFAPSSVAMHPAGTHLYVAANQPGSGVVSTIDLATNQIVDGRVVGTTPSGMAIVPGVVESWTKCYAANVARGTPRFAPRTVSVAEDLGTRATNLTRPIDLCSPVTGSGSTSGGRVCYRASDARGQPPFASRDVSLVDPLGARTITVGRTGMLCVAGTGTGLDAIKCHKAHGRPGLFVTQTITLTDGFESKPTQVLKPIFYCQAAAVDATPAQIRRAPSICYKVRNAPGQPPFQRQTKSQPDALGTLTLALTKADVLCMPAQDLLP